MQVRRWVRWFPPKIALLLYLLFALVPFGWMLTASLEPQTSLYREHLSLLPRPVTLANYAALFTGSPIAGTAFPRYFANSLIVVCCTVVLAVLVAVPAAYGFSRYRFFGKDVILYGILLQSIFPLVNFLIPLYILMQDLGLLNTYASLIIAYLTFSMPLNIWILKSFFDGIPTDMEMSARLDGASAWRAFIEIAVPPAMPGIVATAIFTFILAWDEYLYALTMISSSTMRTLPLGIFAYFSEGVPNWSGLTATAIAMSIPVIVVFLVLQKYFIAALTKGALKY
jgi:multiple sugar transport system permease protein